jgi:hypothetical protein
MGSLDRFLNSKGVTALLDLCLGAEVDSRGSDRSECGPRIVRSAITRKSEKKMFNVVTFGYGSLLIRILAWTPTCLSRHWGLMPITTTCSQARASSQDSEDVAPAYESAARKREVCQVRLI